MLLTPDARRGLRAAVAAAVSIALVVLVYWIVKMMRADPDALLAIAEGALTIIGLTIIGYIAETGIRALKLTLPGGASAEMRADAPSPDTVPADAAATANEGTPA